MWFAGKKKGDGQVAGLYLVCYSVGRFVLEFFRGDLERGNVGSLSTSQFIAIFTAIAGVVLFFWFGKKKAQGPEKNIQGTGCVTIPQPLSHEVSCHEYAKILIHTFKMTSPKVIFNAIFPVSVKVLNSYKVT